MLVVKKKELRKTPIGKSKTIATRFSFGLYALGLVSFNLFAAIQTEVVRYNDQNIELEGLMVWDDAVQGKRPGVLVVHEWWGLNDYAVDRAKMLAKLGYVAFAADMYGAGKVTNHAKEAGDWMKQISGNIERWRNRAQLALDVLKKDPRVDAEKTAAIGYCFGGATVMQMAYANADLDGVVSFHGSLPVADAGVTKINPRILIAHGNADPFIPREQVAAFQDKLDALSADWNMLIYGGVKHSFTNPEAATHNMEALKYDAYADQHSWQQMSDFFYTIFK